MEGLVCCVVYLWFYIYQFFLIDFSLNEEELQIVFYLFNYVVFYMKFVYFIVNDIILQVFDGVDCVYVIDFDVKQGFQWLVLFQSLVVWECGFFLYICIIGMLIKEFGFVYVWSQFVFFCCIFFQRLCMVDC